MRPSPWVTVHDDAAVLRRPVRPAAGGERLVVRRSYASRRRSSIAAATRATVVYAVNRPKPSHGGTGPVAAPACRIAAPALLGRYGVIDGASRPTSGSTNRKPNTAANAPAVLRTSHPNAVPSTPETARNSAAPTTARSTPGSDREIDTFAPASTACAAKKAASRAASAAANVATAATPALPASTGSREGTAVNVARIRPLPYSLLTSTTPRAAISSWVKLTPLSAPPVASPAASPERSPARVNVRPGETPAASRLATLAASSHQVERTLRALIHSAARTRRPVTRTPSTALAGGAGTVLGMVVMLRSGDRGGRRR